MGHDGHQYTWLWLWLITHGLSMDFDYAFITIYCRVQSYEFFRATAWRFNNRLFKYHLLACFCQLFINPHNPPFSNVSLFIMVLNPGFQFQGNLPCFYHVFIYFLEKPAVFPLFHSKLVKISWLPWFHDFCCRNLRFCKEIDKNDKHLKKTLTYF